LVSVSLLLAVLPLHAFGEQAVDPPVDFSREILPVLSDKCFVCHGPDTHDQDQLRLDTFQAATRDRGGYRAIDPDDPEQSEMLARLCDTDAPMPPEDAEKQLTDRERDLLCRWIRQGGQYAMHWAFLPPRKQLPEGLSGTADDEAIDAFVLDRLREHSLDFAPEADRATLARRVALILTGLPPEPADLERFLGDESPEAYGQLVNRLLASPRYGEHRARYWLDAVRYGDTHGLHLDNRRGIYPYRDWVVHALNKNLRLDEFITWQIAGDLLPTPTLEQRVATGFVRLNPSTAEGGVIPAEFQAKNNFDRTETLGTVFLGMTLTCARCHTHKYDPIPQTEYYRLLAFFNSTAEAPLDGNSYTYGPVVQAPQDQAAWSRRTELETARRDLLREARKRWNALPANAAEPIRQWGQADATKRLAMLADPNGPLATLDLAERAGELVQQFADAEQHYTSTLVAQDLPQPRTTRVLDRGEYDRPQGDPLEPGVLTVMGSLPEDAPRNRLGLARWLTAREHPLVARVIVNRVWQSVFGYGLVRTPEDFGVQGEHPTHPELLDWLAVELHDSGWDLKHMLRLMVTSRTFRQQSRWRVGVDDPQNRLLARGPSYRLDAEVLRDMGLWASGLLESYRGGEGIKPYQPSGMWKAMAHPASNTKEYVQDHGDKLYRRSLYVYWKRTSPHPMMTLFDAPSRESSCVRRSRTNTAQQSLGLLNETQRVEMARVLAQRLLQAAREDTGRVDVLFRLLACREPTSAERTACARLLDTMRDRYAAAEQDALDLLAAGEAARNPEREPAELAAWTQLAITVLASDIAIQLY
jgi:hypothetical protein